MRNRLAVIAALSLASCGPKQPPDGEPIKVQATNGSPYDENPKADNRFKVTRVGLFDDNLAYGGRRGIYLILDTTTGREYVGVSGVGISDVGSHSRTAGKGVVTTAVDER